MPDEKRTIKPELPSGVRDYLPQTMIARQQMFDTIRSVYESFGFVPLDTPILERLDVLTGMDKTFNMYLFRTAPLRGVNPLKESIKFTDDEVDLALRFDLTVPLARVVAAYPQDISFPFKRYQIGTVCRGETPQAGRFREFTQFDFDTIGVNSMLADTETIHVMYEVMRALGFENFVIRYNNRKILNALATKFDFDQKERKESVLRIMDKLGKITFSQMRDELAEKPTNEEHIEAPALPESAIDEIIAFVQIEGTGEKILNQALDIVDNVPIGAEGIEELSEIGTNLKTLGIPSDKVQIDLSVARGLGYYTGPVFETTLTDLPGIGSVFSGGRFDGLTNRFIPNSDIPGVGASVGVDRLFVAMEKLDMVESRPTLTEVLVINFDQELRDYYLVIANNLRLAGVPTELYLEKDSFRAQMAYATKNEIPFIVIFGSQEKENGQVSVKNMRTGEQNTIAGDDLLAHIETYRD